jgi:hypothetical protein
VREEQISAQDKRKLQKLNIKSMPVDAQLQVNKAEKF